MAGTDAWNGCRQVLQEPQSAFQTGLAIHRYVFVMARGARVGASLLQLTKAEEIGNIVPRTSRRRRL
jgi:hypothetical protein